MNASDLDKERLQFEREKFEKEIQLREREIVLKEKEAANSHTKITPTHITIWVAILGIMGAAITSWIQGYNNTRLERDKFEFQVILKAATSDSLERNKKNFKFFVNAGIISDKDRKLSKIIEDSSFDLKIETTSDSHIYAKRELLEFKDVSLKEMVLKIASSYGMDIRYIENELPSSHFTAVINPSQPVEMALNILRSLDIYSEIRGNTIIILPTTKIPNSVFICKEETSESYHKSMCQALIQCSDKIFSVGIMDALNSQRKPCKYCYK